MSEKVYFNVELTDTLGGEPNYSWVERKVISIPRGARSQRSIMRRAKAAVGLTGVRGRTYDMGDIIEFRPHGLCQVMYVTWRDLSVKPLTDSELESLES